MLGLADGCLLPASRVPTDRTEAHWTDKGDWLALAKDVGAREVFFVKNEPVLVLAELPEGDDARQFFNRIWSMARPQLLFLARRGELEVYKLGAPPVKANEDLESDDRRLALARSVQEILSNLAMFRRECIETGQIYDDHRFRSGADRADRALVHDLKEVRRRLTEGPDKLEPPIAHDLIGRALFIRYLEDRKVLVSDYFEAVARERGEWQTLLGQEPREMFAEARFKQVLFFRVLLDKDFTYALFRALAVDFNGDTFPVTIEEETQVQSRHLHLLRGLLMGDDGGAQGRLFFFAYRFEVIPIELISSIYEDFYSAQRGKGNTQSSYYTPPAMADFLLAHTLTKEVLDRRPRVVDPSCGSGIFLVETFRRMVRHRVEKQRRRLSQRELRAILRDQIRGIDLNREAVRVTAFSLYLAYLHYQEPREIDENRRLPNLRWDPDRAERDPQQHFDILFAGNAFDAVAHSHPVVSDHFGPGTAEVVVGNPPWGAVNEKDKLSRAAWSRTVAWCNKEEERVIGDKELSQAFVHLTLEILVDGGKAALLLSSGVLFKQHEKSRRFRASWLQRSKLLHIVNFAHVRHLFFSDPTVSRSGTSVRKQRNKSSIRESDGTSPFISAIFDKGRPPLDHRFAYWSARRVAQVENTRAVVLSPADMHYLRQDECLRYESRWKIYWWGGRRDEGLIREMERFPGLGTLHRHDPAKRVQSSVGYVEGKTDQVPSGWLLDFKELKAKDLHRYGPLPSDRLGKPPSQVRRRGRREVYEGLRLLMTRGRGGNQGSIKVRLASESFCFTHSIIGCRIHGFEEWEAECVIGAFWSSLARYYLWLTSGSWGLWHDETLVAAVSRFPIAIPRDDAVRGRIGRIVRELGTIEPFFNQRRIEELEAELDEAIFDLYELSDADRDLVRDMCDYGLDFFYKRGMSAAVGRTPLPRRPYGLAQDLPRKRTGGLAGYLQVFLRQWNADLAPDGELAWEVIVGPGSVPVLAMVFSTVANGERFRPAAVGGNTDAWKDLLRRIGELGLMPTDGSRTIYTDTFVRAVSEHEILIIKRDEARFWTRSAALADADATIAQAMTGASLPNAWDYVVEDDEFEEAAATQGTGRKDGKL